MRGRAAAVGGVIAAAAGLGAAAVWVRSSPWPAVMVIRAVFDRDARRTVAQLERHAPPGPFRELHDVPYGPVAGRPAGTFDLIAPATFAPGDATAPDHPTAAGGSVGRGAGRPVVVWVHGGAWISGSKGHVTPYLRHLATAGYVGVAVDYTIAPEAAYPTAVGQLGDALAHLVRHADELGIDPTRIVLAGDSAGAQVASQLAAAIVNPAYAARTGIRPALEPEQLAGLVLHCGIYDLDAMTHLTGVLEWGFKSALWAYTGSRDWSATEAADSMSTIRAVTGDFPPTFISGGNGDGLTAAQSVPLAERMRAAAVPVTTLFWPADHEPSLAHEYQFKLDYADAREALDATVRFLDEVTGT
ncbi:alpha/beta hydrolase [Herbiconiux sp. CPCC 205716]|uniref:Alpha/beta hydrolase n=1 Tax=Herbiconiux gentiana TaxID=2970912 RepID=A0ABT2GE35_9MICO|nr:alpha/beta hydrolase [Herbiconiux gentiana]MCS5714447.1 alpha/beta hydrolase [Herbiconiux gentiana]